jgi:D-cysteine desulfhydrase family pyridoxal phosphate-dependent enzyme
MLDKIDCVRLAILPTPLEEAPNLAKHLGLSKLYFKRDDLTGLAMGGNKARKLEYEFAKVLNGKYDVVLTVGGPQSNHAAITAAAARKLGVDIKLVLGGKDISEYKGNLLLDNFLGAELRFLVDKEDNESLNAVMNDWMTELKAQGHKPYAIPVGGSTGLGALGYVFAMKELEEQIGNIPCQIILAVGSCGTLAGTVLGVKMFLNKARIIGISVSRLSDNIIKRTIEIIDESKELIKSKIPIDKNDFEIYDNYFREYGEITESGKDAIITCANLEGIFLDPIYTGKAMAGLIDLAKSGIIKKEIPVIFIHTGGAPILFSFDKEFRYLAKCKKII